MLERSRRAISIFARRPELCSRRAGPPPRPRSALRRRTAEHAAVLPQYGAVTLGVLADPLLRNYIETQSFTLDFCGYRRQGPASPC